MIKIIMADIMKVEYNVRVLQEAKSLQKRGYEVKILGFSNFTHLRKYKINNIQVVSFYLHDGRSCLGKIYRFCTAIKMIIGINLYILFSNADIYHAHNFHVLPACFISKLLYSGKLIYDTHESWIIHRKRRFHIEHLCAYFSEKIFLRFIDAFITVNEMVGEFYKRKYKIKKFVILYNVREFVPINKHDLIRRELNFPTLNMIVIFVGGFWPSGRAIFELIESAKYLISNARLVLLGFGSVKMVKEMNMEIDSLSLNNRVFVLLHNKYDEIMGYIMSADIGINLIKRDGEAQDYQSPWKLFEYCMAGLPVISTDLLFHRKVHEKYNIGPLVGRSNKPEEIAEKINYLISNKEKRIEFGTNPRLAVEKEFNWERQEKKLLALYKSLQN